MEEAPLTAASVFELALTTPFFVATSMKRPVTASRLIHPPLTAVVSNRFFIEAIPTPAVWQMCLMRSSPCIHMHMRRSPIFATTKSAIRSLRHSAPAAGCPLWAAFSRRRCPRSPAGRFRLGYAGLSQNSIWSKTLSIRSPEASRPVMWRHQPSRVFSCRTRRPRGSGGSRAGVPAARAGCRGFPRLE